jgi:hypothetical protein
MFHDSLLPKALVLQKDMVGLLPSFKLRDGDGVCEHGYGQSILFVRQCFPLFSCRLSSDKSKEVSLPCVECASSEEQALPKISFSFPQEKSSTKNHICGSLEKYPRVFRSWWLTLMIYDWKTTLQLYSIGDFCCLPSIFGNVKLHL